MRKLRLTSLSVLAGLAFLSFNAGNPEPKEGIEIGNLSPNIACTSIDDTPVNLQSMKGKMVLIDFWASYDATSRVENHQKAVLLNTYSEATFKNGQDFEIISISLDRFKSPLTSAIKMDETEDFIHICDYQGRRSPLANTFGVDSPTHFLIDGNGQIVAKSSSIDKITKALAVLSNN